MGPGWAKHNQNVISEATSVNLKISRDLRLDDDNGQMYSVQICLRDAKHSNQCRHLEVTFTRRYFKYVHCFK
jgi:hypothetical protein